MSYFLQESDTPQRDDSPDEFSNMEDSNSSSTTHLLSQSISDPSQKSLETSFTEASSRSGKETRQQRGGSLVEQVTYIIIYDIPFYKTYLFLKFFQHCGGSARMMYHTGICKLNHYHNSVKYDYHNS